MQFYCFSKCNFLYFGSNKCRLGQQKRILYKNIKNLTVQKFWLVLCHVEIYKWTSHTWHIPHITFISYCCLCYMLEHKKTKTKPSWHSETLRWCKWNFIMFHLIVHLVRNYILEKILTSKMWTSYMKTNTSRLIYKKGFTHVYDLCWVKPSFFFLR